MIKSRSEFSKFLNEAGLKAGHHLIVHSSFRKIRSAFNCTDLDQIILDLKEVISPRGSLIMPAFTYCYKVKYAFVEVFKKNLSPVKVGALAEQFRLQADIIRTSSPTHSFSLWGSVTNYISESNAPESPLGPGSVLEWLASAENSYVLLLGVDFSSLSFGHYIETAAPVPWAGYSPWGYMRVEPVGVSEKGEQNLVEVPGCSKSFINFENYLLESGVITKRYYDTMEYYFINLKMLLEKGLVFFRDNFNELLCAEGDCMPCDERRKKFRDIL